METYRNSVTEYDDVILAMDYAKERGEKRGIKIGEKRGEKKERIRIVQNGYKNGMSIDQIIQFTGLTEEEIYAITSSKLRV
jgi:predicted transposase/invertase (TIGR01784 family)